MLRARPCGEIIAAFGHELEREIGSHAMDPVRSFPSKEWSALPTSKSGPFDCRLLRRGDPEPSALASSLRPRIELSSLRTDSIRMSQAATFC